MAKKKQQQKNLAYAHARQVLLNFVPNPRKSLLLVKKKAFLQNLGLFSVVAAKKT